MKKFLLPLALSLLAAPFFYSCEKADDTYSIPETYDFENVDYSGQVQRLQMLQEIKNYLASANTQGVALDAGRLKSMYANEPAGAQWALQYDASKRLKDKTLESQQPVFEGLMDAIALSSTSAVAGAEGQAGVVASLDGSRRYLFNEKGVELAQLIEKGLMGACFYYQSTAVYMSEDRMNADNEAVKPGEGTAMEHHWDEAFGYYGVPRDFPLNKDGIAFWGVYSDRRDPQLNSNRKMMDAFLKGRAAISSKDNETRDEAIMEARAAWEEISGATAISYINVAIRDFDDFALRAHALSEAIAFVYALQFNPEKSLSNAQVSEVLELIGGSADFLEMNLYQAEVSRLEQARGQLAAALGLQQQMEEL